MSTTNRLSLIDAVIQGWQKWRRKNWQLSELDCCSEGYVERIARDLGTSVAELRQLARYDPDQEDLLRSRMVALGLDPVELARSEGAVVRDLERLCTMCERRTRCARDLASADPVSDDWQDYCPNAGMLKMFDTLRMCRDTYS